MNIFVLFLHSFSHILNNVKLTVWWISHYERKHGNEEKIPKLPHPNLQITFKSRKNGETTRIWFVISFSKVNSPTIHLLFRRQRKFSKLVLFFKKKCLVFLVAGQFLVGMERIWTRCQYLFAVRFLISDSVDKILNQKVLSNLAIHGKGFALRFTRTS